MHLTPYKINLLYCIHYYEQIIQFNYTKNACVPNNSNFASQNETSHSHIKTTPHKVILLSYIKFR